MKDLILSAARLQEFCRARGWQFCFIGGIAVQRWGEPRLTKDTDLTLLTGFGGEEPYVDALLLEYRPRRADARAFALDHRVLLLLAEDGSGIDIALGGLPFEESAVERSSEYEFLPAVRLRTCSAEDLIVMKAFAERELDWNDVKTVIIRQGREALNWDYIFRHLEPLAELKGSPEIISRLRRLAETD